MPRDFYQVLGVAKTASKAEIKAAFRRLALQYHPDRSNETGAAEKFAEMREAYGVLSDDEKSACFDALGPERYADPMEVFRYHLSRLIAEREGFGGQGDDASTRAYYQEEPIWELVKLIAMLMLVYLFWKLLP